MGILYFLPYKGDRIVVAKNVAAEDVSKLMVDYLRDNGYETPPYWRTWGDNSWFMYDFGSHSEFFRWEENKNGNA